MTDKYILRSKAIAARMLGGEMMIMSATDSMLFNLNETATLIWNCSDGRTPLSSIVSRIVEEFDITREEALRDAEELVTRLSSHGLITVSDHPAEATRE